MAAKVLPLRQERTVAEAAEGFLARSMPATTRRSYAQTMGRLSAAHGELAVSALNGSTLDRFAMECWGECAPATWNRHVATLRSFTAHAQRRGWLTVDPAAVLERRREPDDRTKAIAASSLERLFRRTDVGDARLGVDAGPTTSSRFFGMGSSTAAGRSASGGCCTRQRRGPRRSSPPTSMTSTWRTSGCGCGARGATPTGSSSSLDRRGYCHG